MRKVNVVAAIIKSVNEKGQAVVLTTQRGYGDFKGGWEFPGGKLEIGETSEEALKREIREELQMEISVGDFIHTIEFDYPTFHLSMDCFWAQIESGDMVLTEHDAAKWLTKDELHLVDWLPADRDIVEKIKKSL